MLIFKVTWLQYLTYKIVRQGTRSLKKKVQKLQKEEWYWSKPLFKVLHFLQAYVEGKNSTKVLKPINCILWLIGLEDLQTVLFNISIFCEHKFCVTFCGVAISKFLLRGRFRPNFGRMVTRPKLILCSTSTSASAAAAAESYIFWKLIFVKYLNKFKYREQ